MKPLLVRFARAGGAPPPSHEALSVHADGSARLRAGTAWPGGAADAAGVYELRLGPDRLAELERLAAATRPGDDAAAAPDAGRCVLTVPDAVGERRIAWSPLATPAEPVATLARVLDELRVEARAHPLAAVRLTVVRGKGPFFAGEPVDVALAFSALGAQPVTLTVADGAVRVRLAAGPGAAAGDPPPLAWVHEATAVAGAASGGPVEIAPGSAWMLAVRTPAAPAEPGLHRLDGFARAAVDLADGEHLNAVLAAGPVGVEVTVW